MKYKGILILLSGLYLAFFWHSTIWYSFFVVGGFLFLEGINSKRGFSILGNRKSFVYTWLIFILLGILVELIGNLWFDGWDYPFGIAAYFIHVILIGYPFVAFFGMEFFVLIKKYF